MIGLRNPSLAPLLFSLLTFPLLATCGSSSTAGGGGDPVALCKQGCDSYVSLCAAEAGAAGAEVKALCESNCSSTTVSQTNSCSNGATIIAAYQSCLTKTTCAELMSCNESIPACAGSGTGGTPGSGTGGGSGAGTGGVSGTGVGGNVGTGTGGSTGGTGCADLLACCNATTSAQLKAACMTYYATVASMGDATCTQALATIKSSYCP